MPLEKVRKVLKIAKEPISLETPIGDEEDSHLGDFIEDKNATERQRERDLRAAERADRDAANDARAANDATNASDNAPPNRLFEVDPPAPMDEDEDLPEYEEPEILA